MKQYLCDTNVVLRFLLDDIPEQADIVGDYFNKAKIGVIIITVPLLVFVELDFAFSTFYQLKKSDIVMRMGKIIDIPYLDIEKRDVLRHALVTYNNSSISFVDAIFHSEASMTGEELLTFDKRLQMKKK